MAPYRQMSREYLPGIDKARCCLGIFFPRCTPADCTVQFPRPAKWKVLFQRGDQYRYLCWLLDGTSCAACYFRSTIHFTRRKYDRHGWQHLLQLYKVPWRTGQHTAYLDGQYPESCPNVWILFIMFHWSTGSFGLTYGSALLCTERLSSWSNGIYCKIWDLQYKRIFRFRTINNYQPFLCASSIKIHDWKLPLA